MEDIVMKRLMVILAIVCSSAQIFASQLVIKGNIDVPFSVFINGEKYYSYNNKVNVGYLPSGNYGLEIYTEGNSYELLYDYSIDIPRNATVYATFTGDNRMYISTAKDAPAVVINLTPYPKRICTPVHVHHHHAAPKPVVHHAEPVHHKVAPKPAPRDVHHNAAPKPAPKDFHHHAAPTVHDTHKTAPTPKSHNDVKPNTTTHRERPTVSTGSKPAPTARTTPATRK
ncbi:MAG: hypothetical protein MJ198_06720 [Bacteroidales bacterium]|nr:hypothetical protein [Bacteroidales bacterium]